MDETYTYRRDDVPVNRCQASCPLAGVQGSGFWGLGFWGLGFSLRVRVLASSSRLSEEELAQKADMGLLIGDNANM